MVRRIVRRKMRRRNGTRVVRRGVNDLLRVSLGLATVGLVVGGTSAIINNLGGNSNG